MKDAKFGVFAPLDLKREFLFQALVLMVSAAFVLAHASVTIIELPLHRYLNGYFEPPFQYRILCAWLARPIVYLIESSAVGGTIRGRAAPFNSPELVAFIFINLIFLLATINLVRAHLESITKNAFFSRFASLGLLYVLPFTLINYTQSNYWLPYDISGMFFFYAIFLLSDSRRWGWYFLVLPLALFNRETAIFVSGLIFLRLIFERKPLQAFLILAGSISIFLAIKVYLFYLFPSHSKAFGGVFELNFLLNISYLLKPMWLPQILAIFGFLWIPVYFFINDLKQIGLKIAVLAFPIFFSIMICIGHIVEVRIFNEYSVIFYVAFISIMFSRGSAYFNSLAYRGADHG